MRAAMACLLCQLIFGRPAEIIPHRYLLLSKNDPSLEFDKKGIGNAIIDS